MLYFSGRDGSVGMASRYGLDESGIESQWRRFLPAVQTGSEALPASSSVGTGSFFKVKQPERGADHPTSF